MDPRAIDRTAAYHMEPENSFHQFLNDVIGLYEGVTDDSDREERAMEILESNRVLVILDNFEDIQHRITKEKQRSSTNFSNHWI